MILLGLPCDFCHSATAPHCPDARCEWSRCPRCHSYGIPGQNYVEWRKDDYINPYSLTDVKVARPVRTFPMWLEEDYGTKRECDAPEGD